MYNNSLIIQFNLIPVVVSQADMTLYRHLVQIFIFKFFRIKKTNHLEKTLSVRSVIMYYLEQDIRTRLHTI